MLNFPYKLLFGMLRTCCEVCTLQNLYNELILVQYVNFYDFSGIICKVFEGFGTKQAERSNYFNTYCNQEVLLVLVSDL